MIMKKSYHYPTKTSHNQILTIVKSKQIADSNAKCQAAMAELKRIYWNEKQLMIAIPMLISCATTFELVDSLTLLMEHTRKHVKALEDQFPEIAQVEIDKTYKNVSYKDIV
jgi:ferritin-like metal-binding protein YciE